ncbi:hypothetical protein M8J75_010656 [Diaphorina citri]|nr:hypothetical protein M8J75_010656 [Diaphorina citri]
MAEGNLKKSYTDLCISLGIEDIDNTKGSVERLIQITAYQGFDPKAIISHFINKKGSINTLVQIITILLHRGPGVYGTKTKGNTLTLHNSNTWFCTLPRYTNRMLAKMKTLDLCSYKLHVAEALLAALPPPNEEISDSEDENEAIPRNRPAGPPSTARRQPVPAVNQPFDVNVISQPEPAPYDVIEILGSNQTLVDKYNDKRVLASNYLDLILNYKASKTESVASLNNFVEKFGTAVSALKALDINDLSDIILVHLASGKLSPDTVRLFERSLQKDEMPTFKKMLEFVKENVRI